MSKTQPNACRRTVYRGWRSNDFSDKNVRKEFQKVNYTCNVEWIGRTVARRTAPKLPRAIKVGSNEGGGGIEGCFPGVYLSGKLSNG